MVALLREGSVMGRGAINGVSWVGDLWVEV